MFGRQKSLWKEPRAQVWTFYCPHCSVQRRLPSRPGLTARHYAQVALTAAVFMLATWSWFTWKGIIAFLPFWIVFEAVYRTKARAALSCSNCGFDPYLYVRDVDLAKKEIRNRYDQLLAAKNPPVPAPQTDPSPSAPHENPPSP